MKKLLICIIFIAIVFFSLAYLVMAEEGQDTVAIKNTINNFYEAISRGDSNATFEYITNDSYAYGPDMNSNYSLKISIESLLNNVSKNYTDVSYNVSLSNLTINKENTEAGIDAQVRLRGFNITAVKEEEGVRKRNFILIKETGIWKIKYVK